jgi:hypothetical protein
MSTRDLDAVLERIARLWTEMQATRTRDPRHAKLMAEIHDESATYLRLVDQQRRLGQAERAAKTGKTDTTDKSDGAERADGADKADRAGRLEGADRPDGANKASRHRE